ncbi:MAG TPA: sulfotransferase [Rhizomicrobium sp.]|jgi:tetratricopeptide (TPR) repeat protein|nr:sulfotransferase [Rhizomicrobium sp.]
MVPRTDSNATARSENPEDDFTRAEDALRLDRELRNSKLRVAAALLDQERIPAAVQSLKSFLNEQPNEPAALNLLADAAIRQGRDEQREVLLARSLELEPDSIAARYHYACALFRAGKPLPAKLQLEQLLAAEPRNPLFRRQMAALLETIGHYAPCAAFFGELTAEYPNSAQLWLHYGHALRGLGQSGESIAAYRQAIAADPSNGLAWWSLANLKTYRFSESDIARIEAGIAKPGVSQENRAALNFALGKAYADRQQYAKSLETYAKGNAIQRLSLSHNPDVLTSYVARCKTLFTPEFFAANLGSGSLRRDPIFLVGMTRSGSTLVEQILASHSAIEGTRELTELAGIAKYIENEIAPRHDSKFPDVLAALGNGEFQALGDRYLESLRAYRSTGQPFFTDKMASNFVYVGMLQLILPNARIVDVRRHPLACCWSNFAQLFTSGQEYAYRLTDLGRLYREYVELMAHWDRVLPGKVHRVFYEQLVADPEGEIRRLLSHLELPFEETCLQFHSNARAVSTVSSEQVRTPIYKEGVEQWRNYEPWLGQLKSALGPVLECYPAVPDFT